MKIFSKGGVLLKEIDWRADLQGANLRGANLQEADLREVDLREANLRKVDLREANLQGANLQEADLSQVKGLPSAKLFLDQFARDELGLLVYRAQFGCYEPPASWEFKPGAFLTETANPCRTDLCGCGVSFATLAWIKGEYPSQPVWLCRIRWDDIAGVVVPYNTDGKARCESLELIRLLTKKELEC